MTALADATLVITRSFDAPRALVWRTFSELPHLLRWWGPKGSEITDASLDFAPGGRLHYCIRMPDGGEMWGLFSYHEIQAPGRIAFTSSFADAAGNIVRAPFSDNWPLAVLNVWTFREQDGRTILELKGRPHNAGAVELDLFRDMNDSMQKGFGGTFDQWTAYLSSLT